MVRVRSLLVLVMALALGAAFVGVADAEARRGGRRGGFGMGGGRGNLFGLLRMEQVQKELNLSEEQVAKVAEIGQELRTEMMEKFSSLREIQDPSEVRAKMTELTEQFDGKARTKLGGVLNKEQMTRLNQIRIQASPVVQILAAKDVADELKLTPEQKKKLAQIRKDMQAQQSELFRGMRSASREQRVGASQKFGKIRSDADKQALDVLTAEQKAAFEEMQGKKINLEMRRGRRRSS